jgi:UDP-N-acetylglucosamine--N-acetylmuramyl-(pentapeptide) pyrophosphoryl-undecaprenol N-acetylglucosamine transferase
MPEAIARASGSILELEVVHQAGRDRDAAVRRAYEAARFDRVTVTPFLDDVAREITRADVIVARAGAATVAEIAAIGRAAILIPFPHAADFHQTRNAASLAADGAAVALPERAASPIRIAGELVRLLSDEALRARLAERARAHGRPGAALEIARDLLDLGGIRPSPPTPRHVNGTFAPAPGRGAR